jgi:hypothetical protein
MNMAGLFDVGARPFANPLGVAPTAPLGSGAFGNLAAGNALAASPNSWWSGISNMTPGQVGGLAAMLGTMGKSMMAPGNPMQGVADAAVKFGPGMAQKDLIGQLIGALKDSKPPAQAGAAGTTGTAGAVSPLAPTGATESLEGSDWLQKLIKGEGK